LETQTLKLGGARGVLENILRWFAGIVAPSRRPTEQFLRPERLASVITAESRAERAATAAEAISAGSVVAKPNTTALYTDPITADRKIGQDAQVNGVAIHLTIKRFSADATWSGPYLTTFGVRRTTSRRLSQIA
jgi:hypothetical protein